MATKRSNKMIQIRYSDNATRLRWDESVERTGAKTALEALDMFLDAYDAGNSGLGEMGALFQEEAAQTGLPLDAVVKAALDAYREKSDSDGQGAVKIGGVVRDIMKSNAAASEWFDRQAITASVIFAATGSNQGSIRKWLADNAELVAAHHAQMGIDDPSTFNRRTAQHKR